MRRHRRAFRPLALAAVGLLVAACGSDDEGGATTSTTAGADAPADGLIQEAGFVNGGGDADGTPVSGGTLTMGVFSETNGLDPVVSFGSGYAGATEMAAVYDALMRYDVTTGEFVPQMAESLEPNADSSAWTLTLRPGVTFSDGTPLDAAAVVTSMERQADKGRNSFMFADNITAIEATGPLTVEFTLNKSWTGFPYLLSYHTGFVTHPNADALGESYGTDPIGAGPYVVEKYAPGEEIVLKARDDYWAGKVAIDTLVFKYLPGAQASYDALQSGTFDVALLGDPGVANAAVNDGTKGFVRINYAGGATLFNARVDSGRALADEQIRQAIAHATDPELLNERVWGGKALVSTQLYGETSRWHQPTSGLGYDPERAEELVEEAKAGGWDGKVEIVASAAPPWSNAGLALQAMLGAVGIDVELVQPATVADQTRKVNAEGDYDIAPSGYALDESDPYIELSKKFSSTSVQNVSGVKSPEMDDALAALAAADGDDRLDAIGHIQEVFNELSPGSVWTANPELLAWADDVHGIQPSVNAILLFTTAWVG